MAQQTIVAGGQCSYCNAICCEPIITQPPKTLGNMPAA
jgi:hypothetical protein